MKGYLQNGMLTASLLAVGMALSQGAAAQEKVTLRVADTFPVDHIYSTYGIKPWMERVGELTDGAVSFQYFPAGQLGSAADMLALVQSGAIDVAYIAPSYVGDKMPLSEVATLPGAFVSSCAGSHAFWKLAKGGPLEEEFRANGLHLIIAATGHPYQIFTKSQKIGTMSDVAGLKLRTGGGVQDLMASAIGAVPVRMAAPDVHESLSRGTLDGLFWSAESLKGYGLGELTKYATQGISVGSFVVAYFTSEAKWNSLDEAARSALDKAGDEMVQKWCGGLEASLQEAIDAHAGQVDFYSLPDETKAKFDELAAGVADQWASGLDGQGKPGTAILEAFREALSSAN